MIADHNKTIKKRNTRPLYMALGFFAVFAAFIYLLIRPSAESLAIDDLKNTGNMADVQASWDKHKNELGDDEAYVTEVKNKLYSFHLTDQQTQDCLTWLPKPPESLNLIVVPDLSGRINDETNNPGQTGNDMLLLNQAWRSFESVSRLKMNSGDRLIVDVTGGNQAAGQFRSVADRLIFDLSGFKDKSNKLFFEAKHDQFQTQIAQLYHLAQQDPQGADYWSYFNHDLKRNIRLSTLFSSYRNLLIILTDGYLEAQTKEATGTALYTGSYGQRLTVFNKLRAGYAITDAVADITPIMDCTDHFKGLEVLVLEVHSRHRVSVQEPRDPGTPRDFDILRKLWTDWFKKLEVKNAGDDFFNERLDATELSRQKIKDFIQGKKP
ncbi:MAG: hypothetical protein JWP94_563 [Mucilaginibacter sp.]|nr:hypothetical protein [Mucilaginibacter sp.]